MHDRTQDPERDLHFADRYFVRNVSMLVAENAGFIISITFVGVTTVMPSLVVRLGGSSFLVGLIGAAQIAGMLSTQVLSARISHGRRRIKRYLLSPLIFGRPAMVLIGVALSASAGVHLTNQALLAGFFVLLLVFFATDGLASVPWYEMIGKAVPPFRRGRMFGAAQLIGGIGGVGAGWVVGRVLSAPGLRFPETYGLLFLISGTLFIVNVLPFVFLKEPDVPASPVETPGAGSREFFHGLTGILTGDRNFVMVVVARLLFGIGVAIFPFYVLFMHRTAGFGPERLGLFASAQVFGGFVGGLVIGWIADKVGTRPVIRLAAIAGGAVPILALVTTVETVRSSSIMLAAAIVIFVLIGATGSINQIGFSNYVLETAPIEKRPAYIGLFNTIAGLLLVGSPAAGWLLDRSSFPLLFAIAAACNLAALIVAGRLHSPQR